MKKLTTLLALTGFLFITAPALAAQNVVTAEVEGMVCDFCARSLQILFEKEDAVENVVIDLDTKTVTLTLKDGQSISDERVEKLISDSGYDVSGIKHSQEN